MKIVVVTDVTPTQENVRGASALPFHLMVDRDHTISISIFSYNNNQVSLDVIKMVEQKLNCSVYLISQPRWIKWLIKYKLSVFRIFLLYPIYNFIKLDNAIVQKIKTWKPDGILIYGQENSRIEKQFVGYRICHLLPDCQSLYYYRLLGQRFVFNNAFEAIKNMIMYRKYLRMERTYTCSDMVNYLLVGKEDTSFLRNNNQKVRAHFIRHPHYETAKQYENEDKTSYDNGNVNIKFHSPKIKVLIAGRYDLYMKQEADLLIEQFCNDNSLTPNPIPAEAPTRSLSPEGEGDRKRVGNSKGEGNKVQPSRGILRGAYTFTFLGKGWEKHVETMKKAGYEVEHIKFAPDYIEEICKHDIQITPIAIGTGTKGKVLDALANGLLVIGTPFAMENIAVMSGESCIEYRDPKDVIKLFMDIPNNKEKYERIAAEGQRQVLCYHDRKSISKQLFSLFTEV